VALSWHLHGVGLRIVARVFVVLLSPSTTHLEKKPPLNPPHDPPKTQWDDETGEPTRLVGFDASEPTAHNQVWVGLVGLDLVLRRFEEVV
jgi:hypothetical protein